MAVPDYSHNQELLAREIRKVIGEFYKDKMTRRDVAEVLEWESTEVQYGDKENLPWIKGLEAEE